MTSIFLLILAATTAALLAPINATNPNSTGRALADDQSKCGGCPCNKPCYPVLTPPPPPPPPKKPSPITPGLNCPPPPSYIYITGPPGNLYPVDPYSQSSAHRRALGPPLLVALGVLALLFGR